MKKIITLLIVVLFGCKSVDNWSENQVLSQNVVELAKDYVVVQESYLDLIRQRNGVDVKDNLSLNELDRLLLIEKKIAMSSKKLLNSWFDFNLILRQDPGFKKAYNGHFYFRKAIDALEYSKRNRDKPRDISIKESQYYNRVLLLEGECRLAIGQLVAYNSTDIDTNNLFKDLKKIYRTMD